MRNPDETEIVIAIILFICFVFVLTERWRVNQNPHTFRLEDPEDSEPPPSSRAPSEPPKKSRRRK